MITNLLPGNDAPAECTARLLSALDVLDTLVNIIKKSQREGLPAKTTFLQAEEVIETLNRAAALHRPWQTSTGEKNG